MTDSRAHWLQPAFYFYQVPKEFHWFQKFSIEHWSEKITGFLQQLFVGAQDKNLAEIQEYAYIEGDISFFRNIKLTKEVFIASLGISLAKGVTIEAGVTIKPFCLVYQKAQLRQSAYLRENSIVGNSCTIGHCTEVKNSIIFPHSELGHFNYVGDSVVGSYCNLGASTILCNLPFRNKEQKIKQEFPKFCLTEAGQTICFQKKGVVLGDASETGCNSTLGPMAFLGKESLIYPNVYISKGVYPPKSRFKKSHLSGKSNFS